MIRSRFWFYFLSIVWGFPMTIIGSIVALALIIAGYKPHRWGYCYYFEVGENWGGTELGVFFLVEKDAAPRLKNHEAGHGYQNCIYGPLTPFVVCIPSAIRYWLRKQQTYRRKQIFVLSLTTISCILLSLIGTWICAYVIIIFVWLWWVEMPKYRDDKFPDYYSIWFEKDASERGEEFQAWYDSVHIPD